MSDSETAITERRIGRWTYGDHGPLGMGWRLDDMNLVLDYDPLHTGCSVPGAWCLWVDGRDTGDAIDHYLDNAMRWVEEALGSGSSEAPQDLP